MKETIDARDESKDHRSEREHTEERFLEQFAALEESLALLQRTCTACPRTPNYSAAWHGIFAVQPSLRPVAKTRSVPTAAWARLTISDHRK